MKNETNLPHGNYSIDEILAEAKMHRETEVPKADSGKPADTQKVSSSDTIARDAMNALKMETAGAPKSSPEKPEKEEARAENAEKKKKHSFFHRRKEKEEPIPEDDIYYGLQLKSLEEYKREYEETISIDTKIVNEAAEALRRKRRAVNEAVWGDENGPAKDKEPSAEPESESPERPVSPEYAEKQEPKKMPDLAGAAEPEPAKPEQTAPSGLGIKWEPEHKTEPRKAPDLAGAAEPGPAKSEQVMFTETASKPEPKQKPEPPLEAETAAPVSPKLQAAPVEKPQTSDRAEWLERIFRHAGLDDETIFDSESSAADPEFPAERPQPPLHPSAPPVLPTIQPGPPLEPEQEPPIEEPPIQEPPLEPSPSPTGEGAELLTPEESTPENIIAPEPIGSSVKSPAEESSSVPTDEETELPAPEEAIPENIIAPESIESSAESPMEESSSVPTDEETELLAPEEAIPENTVAPKPIESSVESPAEESSSVPTGEETELLTPEEAIPENIIAPEPIGSSDESSTEESSSVPTGEGAELLTPEESIPENTVAPEPTKNFVESPAEEPYPAPITEGTELPPEEPLKADATPTDYLTAQEEIPAPVKEPEARPVQKRETPLPPAAKEPPKKDFPRYRSVSLPLHVIDLGAFDDALAAESAGYSVEPVPIPEPISFPVFEKQEPAPAVITEKSETENAAPEPDLDVPIKFGEIRPMPTPKQLPQTKKPKKRFRFFGSDEDPTPPDRPAEEPQEELEDYNHPADAPAVLNDLQTNVRKLFLRFLVTLFFALLLAGFTAAWEHPALLPAEIHNVYTAQNFMIVQLIFLTAAAAFCEPTIRNGFSGLFRLQGNSDSAVAVAVIAAWVQSIVSLFAGAPAGGRLYASLAGLALFCNTAGKLSISKRILRNFRFLTSSKEKYAVQMYDDYNTAIQMSKALTADGPKIAYQTKTEFLSHFLKHSYASDPSEHVSQFLAPAGFLGSIALLVVSAVLTKNSLMALAAFTAGTCLSIPFGAALSVSLPLARLHKIAARCGGMAVGWDAVEQFSATDAVLIDAQDLFPRGTVVLNGIQTFAGQRIDEAILDATALTAAVGGTLSDLFSQIVKSRGDILPHVERPVYEEGLGISGMVSDRVILVGTGELLRKHGLEPPSRDYEEKYRRGGKIPVYLASGGVLIAMFLVFYRSDRRRAAELRRLESNGITLLVRSRDPNLTPELISDCFGLSIHSVNILSEHLGEVYDSLQKNPPKRAPAVLATKGRAAAMMRMLTACARQRGNIMIGVALQTAGAALGFALAAFYTAYSGISQLSATSLLVFEAFWAAAVVFIPKIRKP